MMAGARSPSGKKRPQAGSSGYRPVRAPGGSSFLNCPGCSKSMHAARLPFHKVECPLFAEYELGMAARRVESLEGAAQDREEGQAETEGHSFGEEGAADVNEKAPERHQLEERFDEKSNEDHGMNAEGVTVPMQEKGAGDREAGKSADGTNQHDKVVGASPAERGAKGGVFLGHGGTSYSGGLDKEVTENATDLGARLEEQKVLHAREWDEWQTQMLERDSEMSGLAGSLMQVRGQLSAAQEEIWVLKCQLEERDEELAELRAFKRSAEERAQTGGLHADGSGGNLLISSPRDQNPVLNQVVGPKPTSPTTPIHKCGARAGYTGKILNPPVFGSPSSANAEEEQTPPRHTPAVQNGQAPERDFAQKQAVTVGSTEVSEQAHLGGERMQVETPMIDRPSVPESPVLGGVEDSQESEGGNAVADVWNRVGALLAEAEKEKELLDNEGKSVLGGEKAGAAEGAGTEAMGAEANVVIGSGNRQRLRKVLFSEDENAGIGVAREQQMKTAGETDRVELANMSGGMELGSEEEIGEAVVRRGRKRGRKVLDDHSDSEGAVVQKAAGGEDVNDCLVRRKLFDSQKESDDDETLKQRLERISKEQPTVAGPGTEGGTWRRSGRLQKVGRSGGGSWGGTRKTQRRIETMLQRANRRKDEAQFEKPIEGLAETTQERREGKRRRFVEEPEEGPGSGMQSDGIEEYDSSGLQQGDRISEEDSQVVKEGDGSDVSEGDQGTVPETDEEGTDEAPSQELERRPVGILEAYGMERQTLEPKDWKLQGDMQAAFGKDDMLCMKAACALYRRQTRDERAQRATVHRNMQGFSQVDATR
jgi:hypothetical protein